MLANSATSTTRERVNRGEIRSLIHLLALRACMGKSLSHGLPFDLSAPAEFFSECLIITVTGYFNQLEL
jgi:hypothetical protein